MRSDPERKQRIFICAAIFTLFLWGHASAGEDHCVHSSATCRQYRREVRLQLRIAEAKRNRDSIRYYKSVARQQKVGVPKRPASACGMTDGSVRRFSD
jgi:hypothetical protein